MTETKKAPPIEFLWLGLYAFAGFSLELLLSLAVNGLGRPPLSKDIHTALTGILWFACSFLLIKYAKHKFGFDIFAKKHSLTIKDMSIILPVLLIIILLMFAGFNGFKPLVEFNNGAKGKLMTYLLQIFYYLGESALIVLVIAFGEHFAETQFHTNPKFPSGGLFLALTWGIMHIFLQGFSSGLFTMGFSVLTGIIYNACKKDFKWSYLWIALAFIL